MKHLPRLLCLAVLLVPCAARADLSSDVNALLIAPSLKRATVGIEIVRLGNKPGDDAMLFRKEATTPLIPASNLKLLTTAATLDKLGPAFKYRTQLLAGEGGDLALIGAGDPSFGDAEFLKDVGWDVTTVFESWADQLAKRNIASVRDVIVDDSIFDETFVHPNWPEDQIQKRYVAGVGGFNLNANVLEFSVHPTSNGQIATYTTNPPDTQYATIRNTCITGNQNAIWLSRQNGTNQIVLKGETPSRAQIPVAVTIHDPPMYAATVFSEVLKRKGITIAGQVKRDRELSAKRKSLGSADKWRVLAIHETPLSTVLARANKDSVNLYAEAMCKLLGHETTGQPGSWSSGTAANAAFLKSLGVQESEFKLDDGSGLSKQNAISAEAFTKILAHEFHSPNAEAYRASMAIAGIDGTMKERFRGLDLKGRVFAKSGYVNGVRTLSGYLHARDEQWYAFSILMNRVSPDVKEIQDKIVKAIDKSAEALADGR